MTKVHIDRDAGEDLRRMKLEDQTNFYPVAAFLKELVGAPHLARRLLEKGDISKLDSGGKFNVTTFDHMFRRGLDIWRIKVWTSKDRLIPYRILYAYDLQTKDFYILAIMAREINYEQNPDFVRRLNQAYKRLGFVVAKLH